MTQRATARILCFVLLAGLTFSSGLSSKLTSRVRTSAAASASYNVQAGAASDYAYLEGRTVAVPVSQGDMMRFASDSPQPPQSQQTPVAPAPGPGPGPAQVSSTQVGPVGAAPVVGQVAAVDPNLPQTQPGLVLQPTILTGGLQQTKIPPTTRQMQQQQDNEEDSDPEMAKLLAALEAVKEDIMSNSKQITDERKWVTAVRKIVQSYEEKMKRVNDHITALRREQKKLFDKKKQIENLRLQRKLQDKLKTASEELKTLQFSLDHVQQKSHELNQEHANLQNTIGKIETQLAKLIGEDIKQKSIPESAVKKTGSFF